MKDNKKGYKILGLSKSFKEKVDVKEKSEALEKDLLDGKLVK
jgi:hypothetical protein